MKILVDSGVWQHIKLTRLAKRLEVPRATALGHLVALWMWASVYRPEGDLDGITADELSEITDWTGDVSEFARALRDCGWIDDGEPPMIHDWQEHGGKLIRQMAAEREKKRKQRSRGRPGDVPGTEAGRPQNVRHPLSVPVPFPVPVPSPPPPQTSPAGDVPGTDSAQPTAAKGTPSAPTPNGGNGHHETAFRLAKTYQAVTGGPTGLGKARDEFAAALRRVSPHKLEASLHAPECQGQHAWKIVHHAEFGKLPGPGMGARKGPIDVDDKLFDQPAKQEGKRP